ncbi:Quinol monooxygenase YgiN [Zunongwangia mangrovi]|uniref:Quinol monooxygenase YgiN n=1 Tax=Zunongwangia mangrovi TaxID=1334022 RepID=A0A1I1EZR7_9FLAO|nr:antibiotic biosynthesis monooxygenase family protein [Zunongwangia mangrovi]SFB92689.1 Quinol monooxygenase YgiN [Zunongwangia mangrovi]
MRSKTTIISRVFFFLLFFVLFSCGKKDKNTTIDSDKLIIRIAEIEIDLDFQQDYLDLLQEEAEASVRLEDGVIAIYPMFQQERPEIIQILEVYKNETAYKSHLETPHFKKYKTNSAEMVKSLKLIDMNAIDQKSMSKIFSKLDGF